MCSSRVVSHLDISRRQLILQWRSVMTPAVVPRRFMKQLGSPPRYVTEFK